MVGRNYQINHLQVFKQLNPRKKKKQQNITGKKKKKSFQVYYMTILRRCLKRLSYFSY